MRVLRRDAGGGWETTVSFGVALYKSIAMNAQLKYNLIPTTLSSSLPHQPPCVSVVVRHYIDRCIIQYTLTCLYF